MTGHSAASSLYSGIFSKSDGSKSDSSKGNSDEQRTTANSSSESPLVESDGKGLNDKSQAWSAALRFTPRRNLTTSKPKRTISQAHLSAAFSHSDIHENEDKKEDKSNFGETVAGPSLQKMTNVTVTPLHSLVKHDIQTHALNIRPKDTFQEQLPKVLEPPPLTISQEEIEKDRELFRDRALKRGDNSFQPSIEHQWEPHMEEAYDEEEDVNGFANTVEGKKARKRKRKRRSSPGRHGGLTASMNMDADYDPRIPNDFNDFSNLLIRRREEERRMRRSMQDENHQAANSDEVEETGWKRRNRSDRFAPPVNMMTNAHNRREMQNSTKEDADDDDEKPYLSPPPPGPPPSIPASLMTGEDAYQKRVAMSQQALTGEEAYQRRMAMNQHIESDDQRHLQTDELASRTAAAAAIAAKLAKEIPSTETISSMTPSRHDPSTFAERLMMKQGWKRGEALGVDGNKGIVDPILAQKVEMERAKKGKRKEDNGNHSIRGTIINVQDQKRREEERQKYGEASEVILLENMIIKDEDIDDDLPGEIGEECEKYGEIERVFIWPAGHANLHQLNNKSSSLINPTLSAIPRIFVKFHGISSAWNCLKELDGRFFAGNTVRARYYPLQDFNRGNYDRLYDNDGR